MRSLLFTLVLFLVQDAFAWQISDDDCLAVAEAYASNITSFRQLNLEYRVQTGVAGSVEAGMNGNFDRRHELKSMLAVLRISGDKMLYKTSAERDPKAAKMPAKPAQQNVVSLLDVDETQVSDGRISYSSLVPGLAAIKEEFADPMEGISFSPFNMGMMTRKVTYPDELLRAAVAKNSSREYETVNGSLLMVSITFSDNKSARRLSFDTSRGFLPVKIESFEIGDKGRKIPKTFAVMAKAVECPGGRWFPHTIVRFGNPQTNGERDVVRIETIKLDVETPVADEQLRIRLARDTSVSSALGSCQLPQGTTIGPDDLANLQLRANTPGKNR